MNFIFVAGRLGADPETRFTSSGQKVTTLRVACNSRRAGKEETIWWKVTLWGEQFDKMLPYLKKGSAIMAQGELHKPQMYTDREGATQISLEMTASNLSFSPFGKDGNQSSPSQQTQQTQKTQSNPYDEPNFEFEPVMHGSQHNAFSDDEIPF